MLYKLAFSAFTVEFSSLALLFLNDNSLSLMGIYLAFHGLSSLLMALAISLVVPQQYRQPRKWLLTYLFSFNFFMPVAGLLCAVTGIFMGVWFPRLNRKSVFETMLLPRFNTHRNHEGTGFRGGQVRAQLHNAQTPLDQRLKALVAVQDTPARITGTLLRDLLADKADDIRLLAYGILDGKEKQITQLILESRQRLESLRDRREQSQVHKRIAELYWELIYQNLVQGDMMVFSAEQVRHHVEEALAVTENDAGLWFLLGRLELHDERVAEAEQALEHAFKCGFPRERLLPYIAEMRFLQRDFQEVRKLFIELSNRPGMPAIAAARRYWLDDSQSRTGRTVPGAI